MGNDTLALAARKALHDPAFETGAGYCQRFVREVIQSVYGDKYNDYFRDSAEHTRLAWIAAGIGFAPTTETVYEAGDILYKHFGEVGHVAIAIGRIYLPADKNWYVAENSSVHHNGKDGAKGVRTIHDFGEVTWCVRLPPIT